jgi:hypothetical protein
MSRMWIFPAFLALSFLGFVTPAFAETPQESVAGSAFQLVILPDTQYYTEGGDTYRKQTRWIRDDTTLLTNLAFVIHMGDMTEDNGVDIPSLEWMDSEWEIADAAHDILDAAGIRYSVMPGNHDYPEHGHGTRDTTNFNAFSAQIVLRPWATAPAISIWARKTTTMR